MPTKRTPRLKRPIHPPEDSMLRSALSREVKDGKKGYIRFIYYYSLEWFTKLDEADEWTMRDGFMHLIISFINLHKNERLAQDDDPKSLRLVANHIRGPKVVGLIQNMADALDARAEKLEIEDTPTEATD